MNFKNLILSITTAIVTSACTSAKHIPMSEREIENRELQNRVNTIISYHENTNRNALNINYNIQRNPNQKEITVIANYDLQGEAKTLMMNFDKVKDENVNIGVLRFANKKQKQGGAIGIAERRSNEKSPSDKSHSFSLKNSNNESPINKTWDVTLRKSYIPAKQLHHYWVSNEYDLDGTTHSFPKTYKVKLKAKQ